MPVVNQQTPTVTVQVPVPQPANTGQASKGATQPRKPKRPTTIPQEDRGGSSEQQPQQQPVQQPQPVPRAIILPWAPSGGGRQRMRRLPKRVIRMSSHKAFLDLIKKDPNELTARKVFADYLEEHEPEITTPEVINRLRTFEGPMWVGLSPKGKVNAIPRLTKEFLHKYLDAGFGHGKELYHSTERNSSGRAIRVRISGRMKTWKTRPGEFRVPWKYGLYDNGEFNHTNSHQFLIEDPTDEPRELGA